MQPTDALTLEQVKLSETLAEVDSQRRKLEQIPRYYGEDLVEQSLDAIREQQRLNLAISAREPYFGRIDFTPDGAASPMPLYIGKVGLQSTATGDVLVVDWRAPVSSLFYSFTGAAETAEYKSPDGIVSGTVTLKRNLVVRDRALLRVVDSFVKGTENLNVTDEYLLYRLGENKDNRLRDIVSTIQAEQDNIIRADRNLAVVIQGVAGSGKTTVALHRLAYLLYQYPENIRSERLIIFAPNSLFLDYISDVLPELGVGETQQSTFTSFALSILQDHIQLEDDTDILGTWFHPQKHLDESLVQRIRYLGSEAFARDVDAFLHDFEAHMVPNQAFEAGSHVTVDADVIRKWFAEEYAHYPVAHRKERIFARLKRVIETENKERKANGLGFDRKKAMQALKSYEKLWPACTPLILYKELLQKFGIPAGTTHVTPSKRNQSAKVAAVRREDLPALMYLHVKVNGVSGTQTFDHVVIDEAQDFSPLQVLVLKAFCPSHSFTILGDTAQNIYSLYGISNWDAFLSLFPGASAKFTLDRSYRSTVEIIEFANSILMAVDSGETTAVPVFRSGEPVHVEVCPAEQQIGAVERIVTEMQRKGMQSTAVVTRTLEEAMRVANGLQQAGVQAHCLTGAETTYQGGISVAPVHLTKGLEFDGVVLAGVSEDNYRRQTLDAKLLYVACTRAMHELWVLCTEQGSPLIPIPVDTHQTTR